MIYLNRLILEGKFWHKDIGYLFDWMKSKSDKKFIFIDLETTGLNHPKDEQITQVAAIVTTYDQNEMKFTEIDSFNDKIKLNDDIKQKMQDPSSRIKWVLGFNRYGERNRKYHPEDETLIKFHKWIERHDAILVIQNAGFDMKFLNIRSISKFGQEVLDTKDIIQLFYIPALQKLAETEDEYKNMLSKIGTSARDNGLISSSMGKIAPALGIDSSGYHDGLFDCRMTQEMIEKILKFLNSVENLDISKYQQERIATKK